jgi:hypothetical protein
MNDQREYWILCVAADGREKRVRVLAKGENAACAKAELQAKREAPIDSRGKASGWRVFRVM